MSVISDILDRIPSGAPYNLHSHTQFCDGRATMAEFAAAAAAARFAVYGFSPHSPLPIVSPCNMSRDDVELYLAEFRRLRDEYAGRVTLLCSMEIDWLGPQWGPSNDYFASLPLDYRIGSVHFLPSPRDGFIDVDGRFASFAQKMHRYFDDDIRGVAERFFEQSAAMIEAGGLDILGHVDKIAHNASLFSPGIADEPWFDHSVKALIDMAADRGIAVEVNTKAWETAGRLFPDPRHFGHLLRSGATVVVSTDAHRPSLISAGRAGALSLLGDAMASRGRARGAAE